jgi:hypothetical protein
MPLRKEHKRYQSVALEYSPRRNQFENIGMLVNFAVIHDDYGVWFWVWSHLIQQTRNKGIEEIRIERAFNDVTVDEAIIQ